jgi:uncharacterized membrane protein HdeD (DUF308 family)
VLAGILCIAAGIVAFAWPNQTFLVLAGIIGWFLLFRGTFNIIESLFVKDYVEQWWLILITGILQVAIGALGGRLLRPIDCGVGRLGRRVGADRGNHEHLGSVPAQDRA